MVWWTSWRSARKRGAARVRDVVSVYEKCFQTVRIRTDSKKIKIHTLKMIIKQNVCYNGKDSSPNSIYWLVLNRQNWDGDRDGCIKFEKSTVVNQLIMRFPFNDPHLSSTDREADYFANETDVAAAASWVKNIGEARSYATIFRRKFPTDRQSKHCCSLPVMAQNGGLLKPNFVFWKKKIPAKKEKHFPQANI